MRKDDAPSKADAFISSAPFPQNLVIMWPESKCNTYVVVIRGLPSHHINFPSSQGVFRDGSVQNGFCPTLKAYARQLNRRVKFLQMSVFRAYIFPSGVKRHTSKNLYGSNKAYALAHPIFVVVDHKHCAATRYNRQQMSFR